MGHSTSPDEDRLLAAVLALGLPLLLVVWLMDPAGLTDDEKYGPAPDDALQIAWVPARSQSSSARALQSVSLPDPVPEPSTEKPPTPGAGASAISGTTQADAVPGDLPMDTSGSVYDPSRMQAVASDTTALLRSTPLNSDSIAAHLDDSSWIENPPVFSGFLRTQSNARVVLELEVGETGAVAHAAVAESSGSDEIDRNAMNAARAWHFEPERRTGIAVQATVRLEVVLQLEGSGRAEGNQSL